MNPVTHRFEPCSENYCLAFDKKSAIIVKEYFGSVVKLVKHGRL